MNKIQRLKKPGFYWKNPLGWVFSGFIGFFRVLSGFIGFVCFEFNFYLTKRFCHGATKFQLSLFIKVYRFLHRDHDLDL